MKNAILLSSLLFLVTLDMFSQTLSYQEAIKKCQEESNLTPACVLGLDAPDFSAVTLESEAVQLSKLKDNVVVLYFWYNSCGAPCLKQIPALNEVVKKYRYRNVKFLALTDDPEYVIREEFLPQQEFYFNIVSDAHDIIWKTFMQPFGLPTILVIDQQGKIAHLQSGGPITDAGVEENCLKLIGAIENCL